MDKYYHRKLANETIVLASLRTFDFNIISDEMYIHNL